MSTVADLRPGLVAYRRCGKANCHCAQPGAPGHGPSFSLTRRVDDKTVTRIIPPGPAVEQTREQIAEYHRLLGKHSAINHKALARDIASVVRGKKDGGTGHVIRLADPAKRNIHTPQFSLLQIVAMGINRARHECIHANPRDAPYGPRSRDIARVIASIPPFVAS